MARTPPARTPRRTPAVLVAGLLVAVAAIAVVRGTPSEGASPEVPRAGAVARPDDPRRGHRGPFGEADGALPDGAAVDDAVPGVARLDPALRDALGRAAQAAARDGVLIRVESGWRSPAYQEHLLREAVAEHGSEAEAARWVATAGTSAHVAGDAVDVGPPEAAAWLSRHGAAAGLCQVYRNEPWHYELRPHAPELGCPPMYEDPTHDPRLRP
jgi:hypothetical protein